jgi:NADPH-dependent curcumin reductase CurA
LAICAARLPVAPAAALTTTVSPGCAAPISSTPMYAVSPVAPSTAIIAGGPDKCAYVKDELGADAVIDYKLPGGIGKALSAACPDGIDVYFDNVGGETLDAVLKRLRLKARIVLCGGISQYGAAEVRGPANYLSMISARARMEGFVVIDYLDRADEAIAGIGKIAMTGKLKSKLDVVEGLENFPEALRRVLSGKNFGKQLLKV